LKKFLTEKNQPTMMVLMMQNEVAKRIVAQNKKESLLSISVKAYGEPKFIMKVPARYFSPAPKVDSAIIVINNISRKNFTEKNINEEKFWEIIHTGFAHKRKKLSSNLKNLYDPLLISPLAGGEKNSAIKEEGLKYLENKRAEELTLKDWIELVKML
jgi:16S rRNA (adenine1518-N6/adenine1519-N6)-dimethyltransferase